MPRLGGWRVGPTDGAFCRGSVSVSLPRLGGWRVLGLDPLGILTNVSVSLPRLGGWRGGMGRPLPLRRFCFSLVAEIGWLARSPWSRSAAAPPTRFSLVAEIGWLASRAWVETSRRYSPFQSRCRDWVVGETPTNTPNRGRMFWFQSRCRDWVVGEEIRARLARDKRIVSVSLPRLGGWRALPSTFNFLPE